jgi:hypothetical protein
MYDVDVESDGKQEVRFLKRASDAKDVCSLGTFDGAPLLELSQQQPMTSIVLNLH